MSSKKGVLTLVYGPMFSGKTTALINICAQKDHVLAFKPNIDTRYSEASVLVSHNRIEAEAVIVSVDQPTVILKTLKKTKYAAINHVVIDEINFFHADVVDVIKDLISQGYDVTAAGLMLDSERNDFGPTRAISRIADSVTQLFSRCDVAGCTKPAEFSYARKSKETQVLVGATDVYGAACEDHYAELQTRKSPQGILISFEGGEGGGKTVQIKRLKDALLNKLHRESVILREPGGTSISEQIREVLLSPKNIGLDPAAEVLLFQAARAQIYQEIVLPSLQVGKIVLMDRTRDSSVVYQGMVRHFGVGLVEQLNDISTKLTRPNITFLLDIPVEVGLKRRADSGIVNRLDMEKVEFHQQVRDAYLELANNDHSGRWHIIDASPDIDTVADAIWKVVCQVLDEK